MSARLNLARLNIQDAIPGVLHAVSDDAWIDMEEEHDRLIADGLLEPGQPTQWSAEYHRRLVLHLNTQPLTHRELLTIRTRLGLFAVPRGEAPNAE